MHFVAIIGICAAVISDVSLGRPADETFESELQNLRQQRVQDVGRAPLVAAYERFIANHLDHANIAGAMVEAGSYCENDGTETGRARGLYWYQEAVKKSPVASKAWIDAQFLVACRLPDHTQRLEALQRIADNCNNDAAVLVRVQGERIAEYIGANDLASAEKHSIELMDWCYDPKNEPEELSDKIVVNRERITAAGRIIAAWTTAPWPKAVRKRKVREFQSRYAINGGSLLEAVDDAILSIDASPNGWEAAIVVPRGGVITMKAVAIAANLVVIAVVIGVIAARSRAKGSG